VRERERRKRKEREREGLISIIATGRLIWKPTLHYCCITKESKLDYRKEQDISSVATVFISV
jgi:DNA invertase Pin-like site-specific DNA recombinase